MANDWLPIVQNSTSEQLAEYLTELESDRDYFETTLRDDIAMHALQGILANPNPTYGPPTPLAYHHADQMLLARKRESDNPNV